MFIREVDLFRGVASHVMDEIAQFAVEVHVPAQHLVFEAGDRAESLYILEEGWVTVSPWGEGCTNFLLNRSGDVFGWSALVEPNLYTATASAVLDSKVIDIQGQRLMHVFERHPSEGFIVMKRLAGVMASRFLLPFGHSFSVPRSELLQASYG